MKKAGKKFGLPPAQGKTKAAIKERGPKGGSPPTPMGAIKATRRLKGKRK